MTIVYFLQSREYLVREIVILLAIGILNFVNFALIYFYKIYIILFCPHLNTKQAFNEKKKKEISGTVHLKGQRADLVIKRVFNCPYKNMLTITFHSFAVVSRHDPHLKRRKFLKDVNRHSLYVADYSTFYLYIVHNWSTHFHLVAFLLH